jgi:GxxExxY protein
MDFRPELTRQIIGEFFYVFNRLGFGFVEAHYASALERRLGGRGLSVSREHAVRVMFDGLEIGFHRLDMLVEQSVVVEMKSTPVLVPYARRQLFNYLRATNLEVGLLLHFGPIPRFHKVFVPKGLGSID